MYLFTSSTIDGRLGKCEVCNFNLAKYTCPKCEVRTCRLECLNIHKKELKCDGIRDKTKYIPLKQITESDLMSDYVFLESCTNYASARRTDKIKRYTTHDRSLTVPQSKLKRAAAAPQRQITLEFLLPNFNKHKNNTTFYDWKSKVIYWRIEWHFISKNKNQIAIDERCNESESMTTLITKYFKCKNTIDEIREKDIEDVVLLLKAEGIRKCKNRYYPMEISRTLQENLNKRTIIEFPVIYVVLKEDVKDFDVINDGKLEY